MEYNGIRIDISREDFLQQDRDTRDWMVFAALAGTAKQLNEIRDHGCSWARNYIRKRNWKDFLVILGLASAFGIIGGASAVLAVMKIWP